MAQSIYIGCTHCDIEFEIWSDRNAYYLNENGEKVYVYHPSNDIALATGYDQDHLCMSCGEVFPIDSKDPIDKCPKCSSTNLQEMDQFDLLEKDCPYCKKGTFELKRAGAIS